jgi:hypothetical protein
MSAGATDWSALERDLMGDDRDAVKAAASTLGGLDDDRARTLLAAALARGPAPASLAMAALATHGAAAIPFALAALDDPRRRVGGAMTLARIGAPETAPRLHALASDENPMIRAAAALGLFRARERDPVMWSRWIVREPHVAVLGFLAAVGGLVAIDREALAALDAQGAEANTPPDARANCVWAVAAHDADRGVALAEALDAPAREALGVIVARRGGPLAPAWSSGDPRADRTADSLGLP